MKFRRASAARWCDRRRNSRARIRFLERFCFLASTRAARAILSSYWRTQRGFSTSDPSLRVIKLVIPRSMPIALETVHLAGAGPISRVIDADHFLPSRLMHTVFGLPSIARDILSRISPILGISKNSPWKCGPLHVNESYRSILRNRWNPGCCPARTGRKKSLNALSTRRNGSR